MLVDLFYFNGLPNSNCSHFSLEMDAPIKLANAKPTAVRPPDDDHMDNQVQSEDSKPKVSNEHEVLEIVPEGFDAEKIVSIDVNEEVADLRCFEGRLAIVDCSGQKIVPSDSTLDKSLQDSDEILNDQNGTNPKPHQSENDKNHTVVTGDSESLKLPNGFECAESVAIPEDGPTSDKFDSIKLSSSGTSCNNLNGLSLTEAGSRQNDGKPDADKFTVDVNFSSVTSLPECADEHNVDVNFSPKTSLSTKSGFVCVYHCCSECLDTLHSMTQKILIEDWRSNGSQWTVEDVHDVVASLSVDLLSAVRRIHVSGGFSKSFDDKRRDRNNEIFDWPESGTCDCNISRNKILSPAECRCHTSSESFTRKANASANTHLRFGSKFVFRDGVLVHMDPEKDVSFHCKFETLCLCSLIELIVMTKPPFH